MKFFNKADFRSQITSERSLLIFSAGLSNIGPDLRRKKIKMAESLAQIRLLPFARIYQFFSEMFLNISFEMPTKYSHEFFQKVNLNYKNDSDYELRHF